VRLGSKKGRNLKWAENLVKQMIRASKYCGAFQGLCHANNALSI
jgi:hypothetical protein